MVVLAHLEQLRVQRLALARFDTTMGEPIFFVTFDVAHISQPYFWFYFILLLFLLFLTVINTMTKAVPKQFKQKSNQKRHSSIQ